MSDRDLKSSNILLTAGGVAKIGDVGLAKLICNADLQSSDPDAGTFAYAAPELILGSRCTHKVRSRRVTKFAQAEIFFKCSVDIRLK